MSVENFSGSIESKSNFGKRGVVIGVIGGIGAANYLGVGAVQGETHYVGGTDDSTSTQEEKVAVAVPGVSNAKPIPYGAHTPILDMTPIQASTDPGVYALQAAVETTTPGTQTTIVTYSQGGIVGNRWQAQYAPQSPEVPKKMFNVSNPCDEKDGVGVVVPAVMTAIGAEACRPVYNSGLVERVEINRLGDPIGDMTALNGDVLHDAVVLADAVAGWRDRHPYYDDPRLEVIDEKHENGVTYQTLAAPGDEQAPLIDAFEGVGIDLDAVIPGAEEYINATVSVGDPQVPWVQEPPAPQPPAQPQVIYTPSVPLEFTQPATDVVNTVNDAVGQFGFQVRLPGQ